jgi:hypothetical protein
VNFVLCVAAIICTNARALEEATKDDDDVAQFVGKDNSQAVSFKDTSGCAKHKTCKSCNDNMECSFCWDKFVAEDFTQGHEKTRSGCVETIAQSQCRAWASSCDGTPAPTPGTTNSNQLASFRFGKQGVASKDDCKHCMAVNGPCKTKMGGMEICTAMAPSTQAFGGRDVGFMRCPKGYTRCAQPPPLIFTYPHPVKTYIKAERCVSYIACR